MFNTDHELNEAAERSHRANHPQPVRLRAGDQFRLQTVVLDDTYTVVGLRENLIFCTDSAGLDCTFTANQIASRKATGQFRLWNSAPTESFDELNARLDREVAEASAKALAFALDKIAA